MTGNVPAAVSNAARDTVFTWNVTSLGTVSDLTTAIRDVEDDQPTLAPDGRTVADGAPHGNRVYLWKPPVTRASHLRPKARYRAAPPA